MIYLAIAVLVVLAIAVAIPLLRRPDRIEVDRFHTARSLTTSWSQPSHVRTTEREAVDD